MTLEARLSEAAACGLHKLTVFQSNTGAWHAVALGKKGSQGSSALRTPEAAADRALAEFLSRMAADTTPAASVFD